MSYKFKETYKQSSAHDFKIEPIRTINFTVNERHNYISPLDKLIFEQIHKGLVFFLDDVTRLICIFSLLTYTVCYSAIHFQ
jgi:hypothetical protein